MGQPFHKEIRFVVVKGSNCRNASLYRSLLKLIKVQQRQRMHLDVVSDDKFHPSQPNAVTGNLRQPEGLFWVTHIHHDLGAGARQLINLSLVYTEGQ